MASRSDDTARTHWTRIVIPWVVLTIVGWVITAQIHLPIDESVQGSDEARTLAIMTYMAMPIFVGVVVMIVYSAIYFRRRPGEALVDGPPVTGHTPIQLTWIITSFVLVLALAVLGITTLVSSQAAPAGGQA